MSDRVKRNFICFDDLGSIWLSAYDPFGNRIEKPMVPEDRDLFFKYLFEKCNFQKVLDKYNFEIVIKK